MAVTIGKAIKVIREAKGKSLGALATQSKLSVPYLSLVESDKRTPSLDAIKRLAETLEVPADIFLLIGSGRGSCLTSTDDLTDRLLAFVNRMEALQEKLKDALDKQGGKATTRGNDD